MKYEILVDATEFWPRLRGDLQGARTRAWAQMLTLEGDATGRALSAQLHRSPARDRRVLIDHFTNLFHSDRFLRAPHNRMDRRLQRERCTTERMVERLRRADIPVRFTNPPGRLLQRIGIRDHKKVILIDDRVAYLGGINFSDHNFAWHDLMVRIECPDAVRFLEQSFLATWSGGRAESWATTGACDFYNLDGRDNPAGSARLLELIAAARQHVYVESPYLTFPFTDALRAARCNGAHVTVITPEANNRPLMKRYVAHECRRGGFELRSLAGGMSHLKAMLIDDESLLVGSSNFDWPAYYQLAEFVAVIRDRNAIDTFRRRVLEPDLDRSSVLVPHRHGARAPRPSFGALFAYGVMRALAGVACLVPPCAATEEYQFPGRDRVPGRARTSGAEPDGAAVPQTASAPA